MRYVVFGSGAIGAAIGGKLALAGKRVTFVARPTQAGHLAEGIAIIEAGSRATISAPAVTAIRDVEPESGDVILLATKSQATAEACVEIGATYDRTTPVVSLQNGTRNEGIIARSFDHVYGAVLLLTAVQTTPDTVSIPRQGRIGLGSFPNGCDALARTVSQDFADAGFVSISTDHVMAMKWGKLVANLNNATHAITGYWLELGLWDPEMRRLLVEVREEGLKVLEAAGIMVEPPPGETSPIRIYKWTEELRRPPKTEVDARTLPPEHRSYASMWQDLQLGRNSHEADFLNGEIVELGRSLGIRTPYNSTLLEMTNRAFDERLKPGFCDPVTLRNLILARAGRP